MGRQYMGVARTTLLIGPDGTIEREWRDVKPSGHAAESWRPSTAVRRAIAGERIELATLLERRVIFVAGKGGTGRSTMTAALALLGRSGRQTGPRDRRRRQGRPRRRARVTARRLRAPRRPARPLGPRAAHRRVVPGIPEHLFQGAAGDPADPARARVRLHRDRRPRSTRHARGRQDRLRGAPQGARVDLAGVGSDPRRLRRGGSGGITPRRRRRRCSRLSVAASSVPRSSGSTRLIRDSRRTTVVLCALPRGDARRRGDRAARAPAQGIGRGRRPVRAEPRGR